jgi:hypothetical protein
MTILLVLHQSTNTMLTWVVLGWRSLTMTGHLLFAFLIFFGWALFCHSRLVCFGKEMHKIRQHNLRTCIASLLIISFTTSPLSLNYHFLASELGCSVHLFSITHYSFNTKNTHLLLVLNNCSK